MNIAFSSMIDINASVMYFSSSKLHLLKKQKHVEQGKKIYVLKKKSTLSFENAMNSWFYFTDNIKYFWLFWG